jgi:hypothetical protein
VINNFSNVEKLLFLILFPKVASRYSYLYTDKFSFTIEDVFENIKQLNLFEYKEIIEKIVAETSFTITRFDELVNEYSMNFWLNNFYCKYKEECTNVLKNYQFEVLNNELKVSLIKDNIVDIIDAIDKNDVIREANAIRKDYFEGYRNYFNENLIVTYSLALQIIQKKNDIIVKQKEYEEIKEKAQKIIRDYNKGYLFYYNRGYFDSLFDFDMNKKIISLENEIISKNIELLENDKRQNRASIYIQKFKQISGCSYLSEFGLYHIYFVDYYDKSYETQDKKIWDDRWLIWNFKNSSKRGKAPTIRRLVDAQFSVAFYLEEKLKNNFSLFELMDLTLFFVPASNALDNKNRYEDFSEDMVKRLHINSSYDYVQIFGSRAPKHDSENYIGNNDFKVVLDESYFKNKNVILFDDVCTTGASLYKYKCLLEQCGAYVIGAITIGKTKRL